MGTIAQLLDLVKAHQGIDTDSEVGARIGKSKQTISQWRSAYSVPEDQDVIRLARLARQEPGPWLIRLRAERSTGDVATAWQAVARKLGIAAAVALCAVGFAENSLVFSAFAASPFLPVHIMSTAIVALAGLAWWMFRARNTA